MPIAPTQHLLVSGFNQYVRNPMYVGLLTAIVGEALLFGQFSLLLYAAVAWAVTASFVRWYEEPPSAANSVQSTKLTGALCPPGGFD